MRSFATAVVRLAGAAGLALGLVVVAHAEAPLEPVYEYDVLLGINNTVDGGHRMNCGWHRACTGPPAGDALDFGAPRLDIFEGGPVSGDVHAVFDHVSGGDELEVVLKDEESFTCKTARATVYRGDYVVAIVDYVHVDPSITGAQKERNPVTSAYVDANKVGRVTTWEKQECRDAGLWSGAHLHQAAYRTAARDTDWNSSHVHLNRYDDDDEYLNDDGEETYDSLGIRDYYGGDWFCISPRRWLWKISSQTDPGVFDNEVTLAPVVWIGSTALPCPTLRDLKIMVLGSTDGRVKVTPPSVEDALTAQQLADLVNATLRRQGSEDTWDALQEEGREEDRANAIEHEDGKRVRVVTDTRVGDYADGWDVTLTAESSSSYVFSRWRITVGDVTTTTCLNPKAVTLDHDTTAVAIFEELVGGAPPPSVRLTMQLVGDVSTGITIKGDLCESTSAGASGSSTRSATGASVTVTITRVGATAPAATLGPVTPDSSGAWSVQIPPNASYITDGTYNVVATATSGSATTTVTRQFTANVAPSVSYTAPTSLTVGTAVTISPSTTDTDIASYALKSGSTLPSGLSLNGTSGVISGTPSATAAASSVTIVATDRAGNSSDVTLSLPAVTSGGTTDPPPSVSYTAPPSLTVGTAVSISPSTTDTDIASYALKSGSTLPSGLSLNGTSGVVSGTPSATAAASSVTIVVTDNAGNTSEVTLSLPAVTDGETVVPPKCTVTGNASGPGTVTGGGTVDCGTSVTLTGTPTSINDELVSWSHCSGTASTCTVTTSSATPSITVTATFDKKECTVTGMATGPGAVSGGKTVDCGLPVTLTATPTSINDELDSWSHCSGTASTCTVTTSGANQSVTVTATFDKKECTVTGMATGPGTVSGGKTVDCGLPVTLTATPTSDGDEVKSWSGGGCSGTGSSCTVTTSGATPTVTVTVTFGARPTYSLTISTSGCCGTVSADPSGPYYQDASPPVEVTLTATASGPSSSYLRSWGGDCSGRSSTCEVTMDDDVSVTATFDNSCDPDTGIGCWINADEQRSGFAFKVTPGESEASARSETPLSVEVTIGDSDPLEVSAVEGEAGTWSVEVPANASFLTEGAHDVVVKWYRGEELVASNTTTITVDLTAPAVSYTSPTSLEVGTAVSISPSTMDTDIASYALKSGSTLPSGLSLNATSGVVSGTPSATAAASSVTIVATDRAGNTSEVTLALPAVTE